MTPPDPGALLGSADQFERVKSRLASSLQADAVIAVRKLPLMMVGAEYVDDKNGSATIIGTDIPKALADISRDDLRTNPTAFVNLLWMRGALVFLNTRWRRP